MCNMVCLCTCMALVFLLMCCVGLVRLGIDLWAYFFDPSVRVLDTSGVGIMAVSGIGVVFFLLLAFFFDKRMQRR